MMQLVIGWTVVGAFLFTTVITCLSLVGWVKFADAKQQKKLFSALILEVVVAAGGSATGLIQLDAPEVASKYEDDGRVAAVHDMLDPAAGGGALPDKERVVRVLGKIRARPGTARETQVTALRAEVAKLPAGAISADKAMVLRTRVPITTK
jgi:hypothetical protein